MSNLIKSLMDFIDAAQRSRKYPSNTASARRSAVRLFELELNEQEKESLDTLKGNLDQIYQNVFNKNKSSMSAESLQTYKNRFLSLINDYEKYGLDATKMANWNRPIRKYTTIKHKDMISKNSEESSTSSISNERAGDFEMSRFELPLRAGVKAIILVPSDITRDEVEKIKKYIDFLESISVTNEAGTEK